MTILKELARRLFGVACCAAFGFALVQIVLMATAGHNTAMALGFIAIALPLFMTAKAALIIMLNGRVNRLTKV